MRMRAYAALTVAGVLWGTTMPLSKIALGVITPGWLAVARFTIAGVGLGIVARGSLAETATPLIIGWGAFGYAGSIVTQNIGLTRTSANHASLLVGATPVVVALFTTGWNRTRLSGSAWLGAGISVVGVGLVASDGGGGASVTGDLIVLASLVFICAFTVAQSHLLIGRDPIAVTAVQLLAAAVAATGPAVLMDGPFVVPSTVSAGAVITTLGIAGTMAPFALFAYGQRLVSADVAGAFVNIEPLVGLVVAATFLSDRIGLFQAVGATAILAGLFLSSRGAHNGSVTDTIEPLDTESDDDRDRTPSDRSDRAPSDRSDRAPRERSERTRGSEVSEPRGSEVS